jgi:hypothetical protein
VWRPSARLLTNQTVQTTPSGDLFALKMADWRAQIERVRQNDPTLTELR